ncbi:UNVERIFIED_CONTAM: hypothetical protein GTU68_036026 [Idotea baltica]|nr:hypothetical protein [Idotea baltica]
MNKILITGANGQLGSCLREVLEDNKRYKVNFTDVAELDICDSNKVEAYFKQEGPFDFVINCAAFTAVDNAESQRELAHQINAIGPENLAKAADQSNGVFVQISTDYVFDGESEVPYKEEDLTDPINYYGTSKRAGELASIENNKRSIVIRTSWLYSQYNKNFVKTMLYLGAAKDKLTVVDDQIGAPTHALDLAKAIMTIIDHSNPEFGLFHYSNKGYISWFDFATAIMELANLACQVDPVPSSAYPTPAKRPKFSKLALNKIESTYNLSIPNWKDSLSDCIQSLNK